MPPFVTIGAITVWLLSAGWQKTDGGVMHGIVPKALWRRYEDVAEDNTVRADLRCLLLQTHGLRILVDNGYGDKISARQRQTIDLHDQPGLLGDLAALGLEPADIDLVILTHLHADHCGGSTTVRDGRVAPAFPNARYVIQQGEFDEAMRPNERTRATYLPENYAPLAEAGVVDFVRGAVDVTPAVRLQPASGHTAHHCVVRIHDGGETAIFLADVAQRPVQLERLAWIAAFDVAPLTSLDTKRQLVADAVAGAHLLIFQHSQALGRMIAGPTGAQFSPIAARVRA